MSRLRPQGSQLKPFVENAQRKERTKSMTQCDGEDTKGEKRGKKEKEGMYTTL